MSTILNQANIATDFKSIHGNSMGEAKLAETMNHLQDISIATLKSATSFSANGSLASLILYVKAQCNINGGKSFNGSAWGISFPGGGALFGDVYLAGSFTLEQLYSKTGSFKFTATPVYTAFYFYDSSDTLLGHFQAGSVSTVFGGGGGAGGWS